MANTTPRPLSTTSAAAAALAPLGAPKAFDISAVLSTPIARLPEDQVRHCSDAVRIFKKKMGSLQTIHNEFQILEENRMRATDMRNKCSTSLDNVNHSKNRYVDVVPFDDNRVTLKQHKDYRPSPTGYINASFVSTSENVCNSRSTSEDFWEMIIQYDCPAIIMLTGLVDHNNKVKMWRLLPNRGWT